MATVLESRRPKKGAANSKHPLKLLRVLPLALLVAAAIVLGSAIVAISPVGLALVGLALVLTAIISWRLIVSLAASLEESQAWSEVARLTSRMARTEAVWSSVPGPAAAWDAEGHLLMATAAWSQLGLDLSAPPAEPELVIGADSRVFVVDRTEHADGGRSVLLREVTRERQALQAKDELLAMVGHEVRTPLSSIKGYGQLMARQLATVQEQVQRLDHLIADVLDTAHADTGRLNLRREPLVAGDLIESAAERFRVANPDRELNSKVEAKALIEGDAERLGQVLDNLLSNAAKYSPPDTAIRIESTMRGDSVRIAVTDTGTGIAPEHLPRLFDRFYRVPSNDRAGPQGFGLGLSIVRDLVEAHRGRVEIASKGPGTGSTFTVILPIALALGSSAGDAPTGAVP